MSAFRTKSGGLVPFVSALLVTLALSLAGSAPAGAAPQYVLKLANAVDAAHPYNVGAREFAEKVAQRSGGRVRIDLFPSGQLGPGEREEVEALQFGAIDIVVTGTAVLANFLPDFQVMDLPFLFRDYDHVDAVLDGSVGRELLDRLNSAGLGMVGLALWEQGFRHLTNSRRPVNSPADVRGLKIRVQENPIHVDSFNALGAQATPMSWGEVYTALEQGVIDGQENPIPVLTSHRIYEVQKHAALTGHFYAPALVLINQRLLEGMPQDLQQVLVETAREVSRSEREAARQMERDQVAELERLGMQFTRPDKAPFRQAMAPVYDKYRPRFGDLIDRILRAGE
ncbi:TRAP transporter substrate-binding protein [Limnochorda pilosa]|uniref:C4-dicarboxylate ABC transporter substrate-binding protein n=1 Tax=Limnochorda pilosa TaxID=1555112 RepID=A0A0K2SHT7_LIMPI|nr:TRAP transporter substrate-binding protein [Limnochorda pilosa]BAS26658.1 C4-dicarboxylate ABC transporter substrate-binding protein [Limnochorda pilosa]